MSSRKKNKSFNEAVIKKTLMSLKDNELVFLLLYSPKVVYDLCILSSLENQLIEEGKIKDYS